MWYLNWNAIAVGNKPKYNIGKTDSKLIKEGELISLAIKKGTDTKAPKKVAKKVIEKELICFRVL